MLPLSHQFIPTQYQKRRVFVLRWAGCSFDWTDGMSYGSPQLWLIDCIVQGYYRNLCSHIGWQHVSGCRATALPPIFLYSAFSLWHLHLHRLLFSIRLDQSCSHRQIASSADAAGSADCWAVTEWIIHAFFLVGIWRENGAHSALDALDHATHEW